MESLLGSPRAGLGEDSLQMWDLNKRLEAYLARVKYLEEENELLRAEIQGLRPSPPESAWKGHYEDEVAALRATLDQAFREKCAAELARDGLHEEVQRAKGRCQKERRAQEEAKGLLALSKRALEEERRAQLWLREKAGQLQAEVEALAQAHREERDALDQEVARLSWSLDGFRAAATPSVGFQPAEVEDYARRLSIIWKGAVETYKSEVSQLEASLAEAKEGLWKATEGNRHKQRQLQHLQQELAGLKAQKDLLEESRAQQWQHQHGDAEKLQRAVESLEEQKHSLGAQIAQVLEEQQQLMHLKMSLSLEVATYRTLLEAESTRLQLPASDSNLPTPLRGSKRGARGSQLPAAARNEEGRLGSRDLQLSPSPAPKGARKARLPTEAPFALSLASLLPKSTGGPGAQEFQKANEALRPQPSKGAEVALSPKDGPEGVTEAAALALALPQHGLLVMATHMEMVSQSFFPEVSLSGQSSPATPGASGAPEEPRSSREQEGCREEGEGSPGGMAGPVAGEGIGEQEDPCGGEASEEPPGEAPVQNRLPPPQLGAEALERAIEGVNEEGGGPESTSLGVSEAEQGASSHPPLATEGREELEEAVQEAQEGQRRDRQRTDRPEEGGGAQLPTEMNGGQETCPEQQEEEEEEGDEEAGLWASREAGWSSPPLTQAGLPKEEQNGGPTATGFQVGAAGRSESGKEASSPPPAGGPSAEEPPTLLSVEQREGPGDVGTTLGPLSYQEEDGLGDTESWQPGPRDPHAGASGGYLDEAEGGAEELEVGSTEAPPFSEDEERRALWSPSPEDEEEEEEGDLQTEMLGAEFLPETGFAVGHQPPSTHPTPEGLFLQVGQEKPQEETTLLCKTDSASPDALRPEAFCVEETAVRDKARAGEGSQNAEEEEEEEKGREEMPRHEEEEEEENRLGDPEAGEREQGLSGVETVRHATLHKEENNLGGEERVEQEGVLEVANTRHEELQENEKNIKNETLMNRESFSDLENIGCQDPNQDETRLGNEETDESMARRGLHEEEDSWEGEETRNEDAFSGGERRGRGGLRHEENDAGNGGPGEQDGLSVVGKARAQEPHRGDEVLGQEDPWREEAGFPGVEAKGHKDAHEEESSLGNRGLEEQAAFPHVETGLSHDNAAHQAEAALREEGLLGGEASESEPAEGNANRPEEPPMTEQWQKMMEQEEQEEQEEGRSPVASLVAEGDGPEGEDRKTGREAVETEEEEEEEEAGGLLEGEATTAPLRPSNRGAEEDTLEQALRGVGTGPQRPHTPRAEQTPVGETGQEPPAPSETPSDSAEGLEAKGRRDPGCLQSQSGYSGSEDSLESLDASPAAGHERDIQEEEEEEEEGSSAEEEVIVLEEALPEGMPLPLSSEQMLAEPGPSSPRLSEAAQPPPATQDGSVPSEGGRHVLEEEEEGSPPWPECGREQQTPEGQSRAREAPGRGGGSAQGPERWVGGSNQQPEAESSQPGSDAGKAHGPAAQVHGEASGRDCAGEEFGEGSLVLPGDPLDPPHATESACAEEGPPRELSGPEEEEAGQVSPLTSVADLGEIVFEGAPPPGGQAGTAAPKVLGGPQGGFQPSYPREEEEEEALEVGPSSEGFPEVSTEAAVSGSPGRLKDSDILEIVEQALELEQGWIEAAEEERACTEEPPSAGGDAGHLPGGEGGCAATPEASEGGEAQIPADAPKLPSLGAKDPMEAHRSPWIASDTNGLQPALGFSGATETLELNGIIGHLPLGQGGEEGEEEDNGEFAQKNNFPQEVPKEETEGLSPGQSGGHGPPPPPPQDEAKSPREGGGILLPEVDFLDRKGPQATDPTGGFPADILSVARMKGGRDPEEAAGGEGGEALSILRPFEEGVLALESVHPLKFRPEASEELWPTEGH